ncbi:MAG: hypothetical protein JHC39_09780 [Lentimicrobium sp.]|jgi:hypothetical protein|nr:hypothetical protein [Lentimicrobium sp.]
MLIIIFYTFLKKRNNQSWLYANLKTSKFQKANVHTFLMGLLLLLMLIIPMVSNAQYLQLNYKITRNGNEIGWLRLEKSTVGNKSDLLLVSEVKTKVVFPITVCAKESASFEGGKLIHSSQNRKTNGSTNLDKQTKLIANEYEVSENGEKERLSFPTINENLLWLYFQEPIDFKTVYCENQQCFVKVIKTSDGGYKVKFPNGSINCFYYKEGVCTKIKIVHTFYSAEIILNPLINCYASNK